MEEKVSSSSEVGEGGGGLRGVEGDSSEVGIVGRSGSSGGGGGSRDRRGDIFYTILQCVICNILFDCTRCCRVDITDITSILIQARLPTHNFENFMGDVYGIECYKPKIPIWFTIYCWKATGVSNMDRLNLGVSVGV